MQDLFQGKAWSGIRIDVPEHAPMFDGKTSHCSVKNLWMSAEL